MEIPRRANAVRNRARILDVTRALIAERGAGVGMDEIAGAAGLAVGTLYRHFPDKRSLVAAALEDTLVRVAGEIDAAAHRVRSGGDARDELNALLVDGDEADRRLHALKEAAALLGHDSHGSTAMPAMTRAIEGLLGSGVAQGQIRADISAADIYLLLATAPRDDGPRRRWAHLILASILRG